jgi:hypothetical protein
LKYGVTEKLLLFLLDQADYDENIIEILLKYFFYDDHMVYIMENIPNKLPAQDKLTFILSKKNNDRNLQMMLNIPDNRCNPIIKKIINLLDTPELLITEHFVASTIYPLNDISDNYSIKNKLKKLELAFEYREMYVYYIQKNPSGHYEDVTEIVTKIDKCIGMFSAKSAYAGQ